MGYCSQALAGNMALFEKVKKGEFRVTKMGKIKGGSKFIESVCYQPWASGKTEWSSELSESCS